MNDIVLKVNKPTTIVNNISAVSDVCEQGKWPEMVPLNPVHPWTNISQAEVNKIINEMGYSCAMGIHMSTHAGSHTVEWSKYMIKNLAVCFRSITT